MHPDQDLGPGRHLQRDRRGRLHPNLSVQVAQQAQPPVHDGRQHAGRPRRGHREERDHAAPGVQGARQIPQREVRLRRDGGAQAVGLRSRGHRAQSPHRRHQGCPVPERDQGE